MNKEKVIIVGAGERLYKMWTTIIHNYNVVAIADNNVRGIVKGKNVISLSEISDYIYDKVLVLPINYMFELKNQLLWEGIPADKILFYVGENSNLGVVDYKCGKDKFDFDNGIIKFELDSDSGHGGISGIFFENVYNCVWKGNAIVIDIGANIGLSTLFFAAKQNVEKVIGYEPLKTTYEKALSNFNLNKVEIRKKIEIYNLALSNVNEEREVRYNGLANRTTFSICKKKYDSDTEVTNIHVRDASEVLFPILKEYLNKKIIMKIDCEGAEYKIFESLESSDLIKSVDIFMIEYHSCDNRIIENCLISNGFKYIKTNTADYIGFIYAFNDTKF